MSTWATIDGRRVLLPALDDLTHREMRVFKRASDLRAGELPAAAETGDYDLIVGLLAVALHREDGRVDIDALLDRKIAEIAIDTDDEDASDPPTDESPNTSDDATGRRSTRATPRAA